MRPFTAVDLRRTLPSGSRSPTGVTLSTSKRRLCWRLTPEIGWSRPAKSAGGTWTFLRRRAGYDTAVRFLETVSASPRIEIVRVSEPAEKAAEQWLRSRDDRDSAWVDATSFATMRELRTSEAFAFDGDFSAAGFIELRRRRPASAMHVGLNLIFLVPGETGGMEVAARELIPALDRGRPAAIRASPRSSTARPPPRKTVPGASCCRR